MNLFLIRHTRVDVKPRICYGQTNVDVAPTFIAEANNIKRKISGITFDRIYSSPLKRCQKLSDFLFQEKIVFDDRLMELNFGNWEMKEWDKITNSEYHQWMNDYIEKPCLNGESFRELHQRVGNFIEDLKKTKHENIAVVAHGGSIRSIILNVTNKDLKDAFKTQIDYGEIYKLTL